jgi:hypothetical protein
VTVAATDRSGPVLSARVVVVALLVAVFATGGLLLSQAAYRGGLGAPLAVVTLTNPVAAATIGLSLLGERLQGGAAGLVFAAAGAGLASWGVVTLSRPAPKPTLTALAGPGRPGPATDSGPPVATGLGRAPHLAPYGPSLLPQQPTPPPSEQVTAV